MIERFTRGLAVLALAVAAGACSDPGDGGDGIEVAAAVAATERQPVHVDSVFPIEEEVRRFRASLQDSVAALDGGAASMDELVARFVAALEAKDPAGLGSLALTVEEFAYVYYPATRFTRRPYEMSPALVWFQLENYGSRGLSRALSRYGGRPLGATGYRCGDAPVVEGDNRIHGDCIIDRVREDGTAEALSLFGQVIERDGRFKFINYANRL
jgi:hypothetical protein